MGSNGTQHARRFMNIYIENYEPAHGYIRRPSHLHIVNVIDGLSEGRTNDRSAMPHAQCTSVIYRHNSKVKSRD